jgi:4-hydroxyproline epimerase
MPMDDSTDPLEIRVVDTHTGGEPTRVVISGGPQLGSGPLAERRDLFRLRFDHYRSAIVNEPRGSDVMVGALLVPPVNPACAGGVIFFNNVGCLGMCGHGTIGVAVALAHAGRIAVGSHRLETPVGEVGFELSDPNTVTIENVPSYRSAKDVSIDVPGVGQVKGDVAWGGNWFFLVNGSPCAIDLGHVDELTAHSWAIRQALAQQKITGDGDAEIDHIELFGPPLDTANHSRSFVLCPGKAYDRSPCGTGTSAKLACLLADGKLRPGNVWRQESVIGSVFEGRIRIDGESVIPLIRGTAYVNGEATLRLDPSDSFRWGIRTG